MSWLSILGGIFKALGFAELAERYFALHNARMQGRSEQSAADTIAADEQALKEDTDAQQIEDHGNELGVDDLNALLRNDANSPAHAKDPSLRMG